MEDVISATEANMGSGLYFINLQGGGSGMIRDMLLYGRYMIFQRHKSERLFCNLTRELIRGVLRAFR